MPKFAANISFLWKDLSVPNRIVAAAAAGFGAVEILFPYDTPAPEIRDALARTGHPGHPDRPTVAVRRLRRGVVR